MRGVGSRVFSVPTVGEEPDVGSRVGEVIGPVGRLLEIGRALLVGFPVGLNVGFFRDVKVILAIWPDR